MRLIQLEQIFKDLGCTEAYNFDGGQSSIMIYDGKIQNDIAGFAVLHGLLDGIDDDGVRGEHLHNDVAGLVDVHRIGGGLAAGSSELIQTGLRHVKAQNRVAALLQHVQGHRQTHNAQTQETNFFHV